MTVGIVRATLSSVDSSMAELVGLVGYETVSGHASELPLGHGKLVYPFDCARQFAEEYGLPIARGCPPDAEDVVKLLWSWAQQG